MKRFALILLMFFLIFMTGACTQDKPAILFNTQKITADNALNYSSVFTPNQRIYYLVLLPKSIKTKMIDIQIIKKDNDYERLGYKLFWSKTTRLYEDQMYYYDDYVVIPDTGAYVMKVYSKDSPVKTLCMAQFFVRN